MALTSDACGASTSTYVSSAPQQKDRAKKAIKRPAPKEPSETCHPRLAHCAECSSSPSHSTSPTPYRRTSVPTPHHLATPPRISALPMAAHFVRCARLAVRCLYRALASPLPPWPHAPPCYPPPPARFPQVTNFGSVTSPGPSHPPPPPGPEATSARDWSGTCVTPPPCL